MFISFFLPSPLSPFSNFSSFACVLCCCCCLYFRLCNVSAVHSNDWPTKRSLRNETLTKYFPSPPGLVMKGRPALSFSIKRDLYCWRYNCSSIVSFLPVLLRRAVQNGISRSCTSRSNCVAELRNTMSLGVCNHSFEESKCLASREASGGVVPLDRYLAAQVFQLHLSRPRHHLSGKQLSLCIVSPQSLRCGSYF